MSDIVNWQSFNDISEDIKKLNLTDVIKKYDFLLLKEGFSIRHSIESTKYHIIDKNIIWLKNYKDDILKLKDNQLHCEDGPSIITSSGDTCWFINGVNHRDNLPSIEMSNGDMYWHQNGYLHRDNAPAIITGKKSVWYHMGIETRDGGPSTEERDGIIHWKKDGKEYKPTLHDISLYYSAVDINYLKKVFSCNQVNAVICTKELKQMYTAEYTAYAKVICAMLSNYERYEMYFI